MSNLKLTGFKLIGNYFKHTVFFLVTRLVVMVATL